MKKYPFKFLDAYNKSDAGFFFGREEEIEALYQMVFESPALLVYGASGTGKSSLIQCGLASKFAAHDWFDITIRRGANINTNLKKALNDKAGLSDSAPPVANWLSKLKANTDASQPSNFFATAIKAIYLKSFKPLYLIFDQFEELFIFGLKDEQEEFIEAVVQILAVEQPVKLIFSIREEYLGYLDGLEKAVPQLMRKKLRVEPMNIEKVRKVIIGATSNDLSMVTIATGQTEQIAEGIFNKLKSSENSKTIQLPYLQVFLDKLYLQVSKDSTRKKDAVFTAAALKDIGNIGDILQEFLDEQVDRVSKVLLPGDPELTVENTWNILSPFATLEGTKEPISKVTLHKELAYTDIKSASIDAVLSELLNNSRILTYDDETGLYELKHDSLAKRVAAKRNAEEKALLEIKRLIRSQATLNESARELFSEKQLIFMEPFMAKLNLVGEEKALVDASKQAVLKHKEDEKLQIEEERKRLLEKQELLIKNQHSQKKFIRWMTALSILMLGLTIGAGFLWKNASRAEAEATSQSLVAKANYFVSEAKSVSETDPTLALRLAEQAMILSKDPKMEAAALKIYTQNPVYKIVSSFDVTTLNSSVLNAKFLITGSAKGLITLNTIDGHLITKFKADTTSVQSYAISRDGKYILTGSYKGIVKLWGLNGMMIRQFKAHEGWVRDMAFSPDGRSILTSSNDNTARLWSVDGQMKTEFIGHTGEIASMAFSPDGQFLLTGSFDNTARLWDIDGHSMATFRGHTMVITSVAFSPDGKTMLTGSLDRTARLWSPDGNLIQEFKGHTDFLSSVVFSPDGKNILTGCYDKTARIWDLNGSTRQEFKGHTGLVKSADFVENGRSIITSSADGTIRKWDLDHIKHESELHNEGILAFAFSPDGKMIATGSNDNIARIWDLSYHLKQEFIRPIGSFVITSVSFSPNKNTLLTTYGVEKVMRLWDMNGQIIQEFKGHTGEINSAVFSPDGKSILSGARDSTVILWGVNGKLIRTFKHNSVVTSVAFSPDGKSFVTGCGDSVARVWDISGTIKKEFKHPGYIISVAFSPDGKTLATSSDDNNIARLWDVDGHILMLFKGHTDRITSVAFSPDGKTIATGSQDKTARLWNLNGSTKQEFKGMADAVYAVTFSPDGKMVITGSYDSTVRFWPIVAPMGPFLKTDKIEPLSTAQKKQYDIK